MRYPPRGVRGVASMNRAKGWGFGAEDGDALCVIQVETRGAVEEARAIAATEGVDVLSSDRPTSAPRRDDGAPLDDVIAAASGEGKAAGILARTREDADRFIEQGFRFVGVGSDSLFLARAPRGRRRVILATGPVHPVAEEILGPIVVGDWRALWRTRRH